MNGAVTRWEPFRDLATLQDFIDRVFPDSLSRFRGSFGEPVEGSAWLPVVDIIENDDAILLKADLPGIDPKDVDIQVENATLTLRGERRQEKDVKEEDYRRIERSYGSFVRSFTLPNTVDTEKIQADYRNGVLELTLPKCAEAKPKQIKVAVKA